MNSKELFGLFLRIVGIVGGVVVVRHAMESVPSSGVTVYLIIKWVIGALVGLYLIRGAPLLVKFAYPAKHFICEP